MNNLNKTLKKWQALNRKTRIAILAGTGVIFVLAFYFMMIAPIMQQLDIAKQAVERAKTGYAFIINNAPALKNATNNAGIVNLSIPVKDAVFQVANEINLTGVNAFEKNDKNTVTVTIKNALPYAKVADLLTKLENSYGITVKDIVLDKQGDGVVYVTRLIVVRLGEGEE